MTDRADPEKRVVWVVSVGGEDRGGTVVGVHGDDLEAIRHALKQPRCCPGKWIAKDQGYPPPWKWVNGCDYVLVERWDVD